MVVITFKILVNKYFYYYYYFLLRFWLKQPLYTSLSIKRDMKFEISAPDLPRTHEMLSNLAAVRRKQGSLLLVPLVLYLNQYIFRTKNFTLIFQCRIKNSICNYDFQNNYKVKSRQINFS